MEVDLLAPMVADCLSENGYQVTIYDNIKAPWLRKDQKMVVGNILDFEELKIVTEGAEFVYNFAGITDLNEASTNPIQTVEIIILGNVNILEACRINKIERFIYARYSLCL